MSKVIIHKGLLALTSLFILSACTTMEEDSMEGEAASGQPALSTETEPDNKQTLMIKDSAGNKVEVPADPQKVAVFDNGQLDNLAVLGLSDRVVLTGSPHLPEHLLIYQEVEAAGSFFEIDLEATHAAEPDLIIVAGRSSGAYAELSNIAPTLDLSHDAADYLTSLDENLSLLGYIFDRKTEARSVIDELENELLQLQNKAEASKMTTLVTLYNEGALSAYGSGSRFGVVHDAFKLTPSDKNIEVSNHGMAVTYEYVLSKNPDLLFVIDRTAAIGGEGHVSAIEDSPVIQQTVAFQTDSIYYLSPSAWYLSGGGAQTFSIMMEEVSEVFK
ncbi:Iron compound ABC transporter, periplasmic iron compound-binding protein [Alkalibacterium sp. AK22]|uniref:siderophore ABC transporter substrate-binding protein n=1 Tax=Alkalibacterium sp. AK22 TaxID=1229520 RepID=UPI0004489125|nr:ABC transporter substrate-binding protein [Alkalibacterium sp. AK22]EXJ22837.1 Iron compound ABC transporter, periplasmic iron compound-binding protein [Alkalibacterium sp. AK22]